MKGFSPQNLKYMPKFAEEYKADKIGQQAVDQYPVSYCDLDISCFKQQCATFLYSRDATKWMV